MALQTSPGHPQTGCTLEGGFGRELWCQEPDPSHVGPDLNKSQDLNHTEQDLPLSVLTVSRGQDHSSQYNMANHILIWKEARQSKERCNSSQ